jgi:uncharacterized membrane protein
MRLDEAAQYVILASQPLSTITTNYLHNTNHPLHTLLVHFVTRALGSDAPWCIRLPALVAGVMVIPATYAVFGRLFDRRTGLLAAALTAFVSPLVEYSTNARGYTLEVLLVLVVIYAAARVLRTGRRAWWGALVSATLLGFYTMPTMTMFFASTAVWMLQSTRPSDRRRWPCDSPQPAPSSAPWWPRSMRLSSS